MGEFGHWWFAPFPQQFYRVTLQSPLVAGGIRPHPLQAALPASYDLSASQPVFPAPPEQTTIARETWTSDLLGRTPPNTASTHQTRPVRQLPLQVPGFSGVFASPNPTSLDSCATRDPAPHGGEDSGLPSGLCSDSTLHFPPTPVGFVHLQRHLRWRGDQALGRSQFYRSCPSNAKPAIKDLPS